jgi:uncharacterized protein
MMGCDTVYARGWTDDEIVVRATREARTLITRDRALAARMPGSVLLGSGEIDEQLRAVREALPELPADVTFTRCTLCNGNLVPDHDVEQSPRAPVDSMPTDRARYRCETCGHRYWEGSHTAEVRRRLRATEPSGNA